MDTVETSVFIDIADEIEALLDSPRVDGVSAFYRDRLSPVIKENQLAFNLKLDKSDGQSGGVSGAPTDWSTDFELECYARAPADQLPTRMVDRLIVAVWKRLSQASALPELNALAVQDVLPDPRITWDLGEGSTPQICATVSVRIIHRTKPGELVAWNT